MNLFLVCLLIFILICILFFRKYPDTQKPAPGVISGNVAYNGQPAASTVYVINADGTIVTQAVTDVAGNFTLSPITYGSYHLKAVTDPAPDGSWGQADQDITLKTPTLSVTLTLAYTFEETRKK